MRAVLIVGLLSPLLTACGFAGNSSASKEGESPAPEVQEVFEGPVARANCGPGSMPETDIQGRVPISDRDTGRSLFPYTCNLELVGSNSNRGAGWQMAWYDDCAYHNTNPGAGGDGVQVIDATDPANPKTAGALNTDAMKDPWESLKVNEKRGLLAAVGPGAIGPLSFDLYDVTLNGCAQPYLLASKPIDGIGHEGNWAPDGRTYYGAALFVPEIMAIDTTNQLDPQPIMLIARNTHGLDVSEDGNRLYLAAWATTHPNGETRSANGLEIYDVSLLNRAGPTRTPAQPVPVGSVHWTDGSTAQHPIPVTIKGKPYVIFVDEGGLGMARIIDISDEANPKVISKLKLEINMPDTCAQRVEDGMGSGTNCTGGFNYQGHYCGVDSRTEATALACSYFWSGVRVFDIRDPYRPTEIAYYNPGGKLEPGPGSQVAANTVGSASAQVRFVKERGELWFTDQLHGFMIARFTNGSWPFPE